MDEKLLGYQRLGVKRKKIVRLLLLAVAVCGIAAAGLIAAWRCGAFLPAWIEWKHGRIEGYGAGEPETICLERGRLWAAVQGETAWQIGRDVRVQDVLYCDIDRDGARELLVLCWRWGRYGTGRPFWVKRDERGWFQHIYIYRWDEGTMRPLWMASDIGMEAVRWRFDETGRLAITDRSGSVTVWDWRSWGLEMIAPTSLPLQKRSMKR